MGLMKRALRPVGRVGKLGGTQCELFTALSADYFNLIS